MDVKKIEESNNCDVPMARPMSSASLIPRLSLLSRHSRRVSSGSSGSTQTSARLLADTLMCDVLARKLELAQQPSMT